MTKPMPKRIFAGQGIFWWVLALVAVAGCAPKLSVPRPLQLQAWVVYFDAERGLAELREHGKLFDRISLFAYELDPGGSPQPAPNMSEMVGPFLSLAREMGFSPWVTVVNDIRHGPDSAIVKDPELIHDLLFDSDRRTAHVRELAEQVLSAGFAGLHLDYERVAESDSTEYRMFVRELRDELERRGLELEVVLEPINGPLPEVRAARVTVMAYDLFGTHSGPGPRSTPAFVVELGLRGSVDADTAAALAVAVGGFAWDSGGAARPLDWSEGHRLLEEAPTRRRSVEHGVPSARLDDGTELWIEDSRSLFAKWEAGWSAGFRRLAIWRLGGNDESLFRSLRDLTPRD